MSSVCEEQYSIFIFALSSFPRGASSPLCCLCVSSAGQTCSEQRGAGPASAAAAQRHQRPEDQELGQQQLVLADQLHVELRSARRRFVNTLDLCVFYCYLTFSCTDFVHT